VVPQPVPEQVAATSAALSLAYPLVAESHGPVPEHVDVATAVEVRAVAAVAPPCCVAASSAGSSVPVLVLLVVVGHAEPAARQSADADADVTPNRPPAGLPGCTATEAPVPTVAWQPPTWPVHLAAPSEVERLTGSVAAPLPFPGFGAPTFAARIAAALPPLGAAAAAESAVTLPVHALSGQSIEASACVEPDRVALSPDVAPVVRSVVADALLPTVQPDPPPRQVALLWEVLVAAGSFSAPTAAAKFASPVVVAVHAPSPAPHCAEELDSASVTGSSVTGFAARSAAAAASLSAWVAVFAAAAAAFFCSAVAPVRAATS
jgi:hypothetical protein